MFRRAFRPLSLALIAVSGACAQPSAQAPGAAAVPPAAPAMRVYRDPATGALGEPPPGAAPLAAPRARPVLTEEAAPGGGRMIRLHGACRSDMVAHVDAHGTTASCTSAP
jgi:hypothetical protein